jgi:hypothetical protein
MIKNQRQQDSLFSATQRLALGKTTARQLAPAKSDNPQNAKKGDW